jgi:hypothetical protein
VDNLAEKVICVEVLERIERMLRFLAQEQSEDGGAGAKVIGVFTRTLEGLLNSISPVSEVLSIDGQLDANERVVVTRRLDSLSASLHELHWQLEFVRGEWVRPATHVFLRNIWELVPASRRLQLPSIVLSNAYSFQEMDLPAFFEDLLRGQNVHIDLHQEHPTVFLPKSDRDNPLNWAILAHEFGHIDKEGVQGLLEVRELFPDDVTQAERQILENWAVEIYCDLFATRILGPAYLASFASYLLLSAGFDVADSLSETHPPDIVRVCTMRRVLETRNLSVALSGEFAETRNLGDFFYHVLEARSKTERLQIREPIEELPDYPSMGREEFCDAICDHLEESVDFKQDIVSKDFARTPRLAERMQHGVPIGSYRDEEPARVALVELEKALANGSPDVVAAAYQRLKPAAQERRALPWDILNGGWLNKVEVLYPESFRLFFSGTAPLKAKLNEFAKMLRHNDALLVKSIEDSEAFRRFGRGDGSNGPDGRADS